MSNQDIIDTLKHLVGSRYVPSVNAYIKEMAGMPELEEILEDNTPEHPENAVLRGRPGSGGAFDLRGRPGANGFPGMCDLPGSEGLPEGNIPGSRGRPDLSCLPSRLIIETDTDRIITGFRLD